MPTRLLFLLALVAASPAHAASLSMADSAGVVGAAGQTFTIQYVPGSDSGGFQFDLEASPAGRIAFTAAQGSVPNGSTPCAVSATLVRCLSSTNDPSIALGAGSITITYTASGTPGPVSIALLRTEFIDQQSMPEPGTASGGTLQLYSGAVADIAVSLGNGASVVVGGEVAAWELRVSNAGPSPAEGVRLTLGVPSGLAGTTWSCSSVELAACPGESGGGNADVLVDLPAGGVLRFVLAGMVSASPGTTVNAMADATVADGTTDPNASNNAAADGDPVVQDLVMGDDFEGLPAAQSANADALPAD